ncbi:53_t:CDS:1, partial [Gigaspora rosea]
MHKESSTSNAAINKDFSLTDFFLVDIFQEKLNFSCSGPSGAEESFIWGDPCSAAEEFGCDNLR